MAVSDILYSIVGVLILTFILLLVVIWYLWYIFSNLQNDNTDLINTIQQQNLLLAEMAKQQGIKSNFVIPKRMEKRISVSN